MIVFANGEYISSDEVKISPFDHGFLYGLGLFETFRIYEGHPFLLDDHLARLNEGLRTLGIKAEYRRHEILPILKGLLAANSLENAYVRMNVSAGNGEIGLQTAEYEEPNLILFMKPLGTPSQLGEKKLALLNIRRNTPEGATRLKSHHYLNNILAKRELGASSEAEGIFLTREGFLAEGIVSNLFWTEGETLFTPSVETGILNGITRQFVMKLAGKLQLGVQEGFYPQEALLEAEELFVTNSIQEVVPVSMFGQKTFPGKEGRVVQALSRQYGECRRKLWTRNSLQ
ncbi:4-amino-4-deoxychorismate lyase [Mesobacillus campisalis]|uniref:aminodeoxychorismate lyase n=1 Tax=Mesobacillus campisalis TaxID=1408103 RepID=A0A0M2SUH4_9BACI|nr:aminodeoxychorismate lyase [Mesobacillus campisalis]KKK36642.1 4-amino-4-deoxychorismate lyase [Mesobacillus campisalis]